MVKEAKVSTKQEKRDAVMEAAKNPLRNVPAGKYVVTGNLKFSAKIQKVGIPVVHMTGGTVNENKRHYFLASISGIKEALAKKKIVVTTDELEGLSEAEKVEPTKFPADSLKEMVEKSGKLPE